MSKRKMIQRKFEGCLVGLVCGDALGAPAEFMTPLAIMQKLGLAKPLREMVGGGWLKIKPGEYTDDSDMMFCIAESLAELGYYDPDDIARRFVLWYKSDPKDMGKTTRGALANIAGGISWQEAGNKVNPANGSVMRCAPIGLAFAFNEEKLIEVSVETSIITHAHPDAVASCILINLMISKLVQGKSRKEAFESALKRVKNFNRSYVEKFFESPYEPDASKGLAVNTAILAIRALMETESFEEVVVKAVNFGGDADTTGAVAGALAGAYWGIEAIPERWSSKLNPYSAEKIKEIADKIFELAKEKTGRD